MIKKEKDEMEAKKQKKQRNQELGFLKHKQN